MIGDLLYESAEIAFDTATGRFKNPKTGADLGQNVPSGGWAVPWYAGPGGSVVVPVGSGAVAQSESEAQAIASKVQKDLSTVTGAQGSQSTTVVGQQNQGSTSTTGQSTPGTVATPNISNMFGFSVPDYPSLDFFGIPWYVWGIGAIGIWYMMSNSGGYSRRRNPGKTLRAIRRRIGRSARRAGMPRMPYQPIGRWAQIRYKEEQSFKRGRKDKAPEYPNRGRY